MVSAVEKEKGVREGAGVRGRHRVKPHQRRLGEQNCEGREPQGRALLEQRPRGRSHPGVLGEQQGGHMAGRVREKHAR